MAKKKPPEEVLILTHVVRCEEKAEVQSDRRRRVNYVLVAYRGADGSEYRKSFASYGEPVVPQSGTHSSLAALKEQW